MDALVYSKAWDVSLAARPAPAPLERDEVLLGVRATGICGTDVGIASGAYSAKAGVVLGHESAGEVLATGPLATRFRKGDRVVVDPTFYCGQCRHCRTSRANHCELKGRTETGVSSDGTFAPLHVTTERFLHALPDGVDYDAASLTEPLSCAVTGVNQLRAHPALRAVVLGAGPMGMLYSWVLATRGLCGVIVEASSARREVCRAVAPAAWSTCSSLDEAAASFGPEGQPLDVVVDTTGALAAEAFQRLSRGGELLLVGLRRMPHTFDVGAIADRSLSVLGSIDSLNDSFSAALHLIASGAVPAGRLVTHRLPMAEFRAGFGLLGCDLDAGVLRAPSGALKVVLRPSL
ncbi:MAG TPA: alcohol dehydrogenase catalytic domain-containing protein [Polyangiaceae bacterium]|jgi:threonine dehydrogenase-like Zn-dependent dehydrogenase